MRVSTILLSFVLLLLIMLGLGFSSSFTEPSTIKATINIDPDTLNLKTMRKYITAYITLPESYDVQNINISSIRLEGLYPALLHDFQGDVLMIKFDGPDVINYIISIVFHMGIIPPQANFLFTLEITGQLNNGVSFKGSDQIKIINLK